MTDLAPTIEPNSQQMNADDLLVGPKTITVREVRMTGSGDQQPISIFYEGDDNKPYKPCKSMRRVLIKAWGTEGKEYAGRGMTLFCDPNVMFGGQKVGGIRISHLSHIDNDLNIALTMSKGKKAGFRVRVLEKQSQSGASAPSSSQGAPDSRQQDVSEPQSDAGPLAGGTKEASEKAAGGGMAVYQDWFTEQSRGEQAALVESGQHEINKKSALKADDDTFPGDRP